MSFRVSVQSGDALEVYSAPVAADGDMFELWSRPAASLGFRIIEGAYEKGAIVQGRYLQSLKRCRCHPACSGTQWDSDD
jgi:hypothetical protein